MNSFDFHKLIDKYIQGALTDEERLILETHVNSNAEYKQQLEEQAALIKGLDRIQIKEALTKAGKTIRFRRLVKNVILAAVTAAIAIGIVAYFSTLSEYVYIEGNGEELSLPPSKSTPAETFSYKAKQDTVFESFQGTVLAIPDNAFVDSKGNIVKENIEVRLEEAYTPRDIILKGLSTLSDGKLLESGGMFKIEAYAKGEQLALADGKSIFVDVPTHEKNKSMMLYDGQVADDGSVNWTNPKPLKNHLKTVDIHSLNFYPAGYEDSLESWSWGDGSSSFKDSLFYSFSAFQWKTEETYDTDLSDSVAAKLESNPGNQVRYEFVQDLGHAEAAPENSRMIGEYEMISIDPSDIGGFWNDKFQNTLLATKEFEERMPYIYEACDIQLLKTYLNNLDKPMHQIDAMAARKIQGKLSKKFREFAKRLDGSVPLKDGLLSKLNSYYTQKSKALQMAAAKTVQDFNKKHQKLNLKFNRAEQEHISQQQAITQQNFNKEFEINLKNTYNRLGLKLSRPRGNSNYRANVTTLGWKNIDAQVLVTTQNRETTTLKANGKEAKLVYEPLQLTIANESKFDILKCYLMCDDLYSFINVKRNETGQYTYKLNQDLKYHLAIVGYKGEQCYTQVQEFVEAPKELALSLQEAEEKEFFKDIARLTKHRPHSDIKKDVNFEKYKIADEARKLKVEELRKLRDELAKVIHSCIYLESLNARVEDEEDDLFAK